MDAELKAKWVAALRGGEYRQGHGYLEQDGAHCCLGVLCKVAGWPTFHSQGGKRQVLDDDEKATAGIVSQFDLIDLNDQALRTFPEIADWIEANL